MTTIKTAHQLAAAFGYLYKDEVDALHELALMLDDNPLVVNIGAGSGTSALALLEARPDLQLITVDKQLEGSPLGSIEGERNALEPAGFLDPERYMAIEGKSISIGHSWDGNMITTLMGVEGVKLDMIFIDGDHSYNGCRGDIEAWLPHIKDNGIMALHDYTAKVWPNVFKAVADTLAGKFEEILQVDTIVAFRIVKSND